MKFKTIQDLLDEGIVLTEVGKNDNNYIIWGKIPSRIVRSMSLLSRHEFHIYGDSIRECKDKLLEHANKYWDV
jgi:predicted methyltransferase